MPFFEEDQVKRGGLAPQMEPALELNYDPDFFAQTIPAAFKMGNTVANLAEYVGNTDFGLIRTPYDVDPDPDFDPFQNLSGYENYVDAFIDARNSGDVDRIKRRIDDENLANLTLSDAGGLGVVAGLAAGIVDPINLIPFGAGAKAAQGGRILSGIAEGAKVGLLSSAAIEPILQANQLTRTWKEGAFDIGASTILAGAIGGGGYVLADMLGAGRSRSGMTAAFKDIESRIDADLNTSGRDMTRPGFIDISEEAALADLDPEMAGGQFGSVGAAAVKDTTIAEETLKSSMGLDKVLKAAPGFMQSPMIRTATSASLAVRRVAQELVETPFRYVKNTLGIASPQAVETRIKQWEAKLASALSSVDQAFVEYRTGKAKPGVGDITRLGVSDLFGKGGRLDYHAFKEEVGKAMRRGDTHPNPQVAKAAQAMRRELFEPLKNRAIEAGLLPEDVTVATAVSYLTRVYNVDKIVAQRGQFEGRIVDWLKEHQATAAARVADLETKIPTLQKQVLELEEKLRKLNGVAADPATSRTADMGLRGEARAAWKKGQTETTAAERDVMAAKRELDQAERALAAAEERVAKFSPDQPPADHPLRQMIRDIKKGRKEPQSLAGWVRSRGGVQDPGGDVAQIIGQGPARSGGLLRKTKGEKGTGLFKPAAGGAAGNRKDGWSLDEITLQAWEEGFFPGREERPTTNDFLDALNGDVNGWAPVYRVDDFAEVEYQAQLADWEQFLDENGIDVNTMSEGEIVKRIETGVFGKTPDVADGDVRIFGAGDGAWTRELADAQERAAEKGVGVQYMDVSSGEFSQAFMVNPDEPAYLVEVDGFTPTASRARAYVEKDISYREPTSAAKAKVRETEVFRGQFEKRAKVARERSAKAEAKLADARIARDTARLQYYQTVADLQNTHAQLGKASRQLESAQKRLDGDRSLIVADDAELRDEARQIVDNISGASPGRLSYEGFTISPLTRGPTKERVLAIADEKIEDFLESDIEHIARVYNRTMSADAELAGQFGRADLQQQIRQVQEEYAVKRAGVTDEKIMRRLDGEMKRDLEDIQALRDRLRGTYGMPRNAGGLAVRGARMIKGLNYLRLMGGMTLSAVPDLGRSVMIHGLQRVASQGIAPMVANWKGFRMAAREVKLAGTALDMILDNRAMQLADVWDDYGRLSKFERGVNVLQNKFGLVSLMAPWNAAMKQFVGVITQTRILEALAGGKPTKREIERLAYLGIDGPMAKRIKAQFEAHGERQEGGVWWANTEGWTDGEAVSAYRGALVKEVDSAIVTPGAGDKPLWTSTTLGGLVSQFKGFGFASTQRVALAGLQQRDAAALNGMFLSVALGMLSYAAVSKLSGRETTDDPAKWIGEGIDRSGLIGMFSDVVNLGARTMGVGWSGSRYASRGNVEMFLGPSAGLINDTLTVMGAGGDGKWTATETHAARRLVPYQNLFYLRWLFDAAEDGINQAAGLPVQE